jgi:hypothetical protein
MSGVPMLAAATVQPIALGLVPSSWAISATLWRWGGLIRRRTSALTASL